MRARQGGSTSRLAQRILTVVAWAALVAAAAGMAMALAPVRNGTVQDCGVPAAYLLYARIDAFVDAEGNVSRADGSSGRVPGADIDGARERPCRERVASRMVPAAAALLGAALLGLVAVIGAATGAWRHRSGSTDASRVVEPAA